MCHGSGRFDVPYGEIGTPTCLGHYAATNGGSSGDDNDDEEDHDGSKRG